MTNFLLAKPVKLGRPSQSCNDIKIGHKEQRMLTSFMWPRIRKICGCCEHEIECFGFIKVGEFLDYLNICLFVKMEFGL
jgi:hypothetical protein